jgi:hypothetical protein
MVFIYEQGRKFRLNHDPLWNTLAKGFLSWAKGLQPESSTIRFWPFSMSKISAFVKEIQSMKRNQSAMASEQAHHA